MILKYRKSLEHGKEVRGLEAVTVDKNAEDTVLLVRLYACSWWLGLGDRRRLRKTKSAPSYILIPPLSD